MFLVVHTAWNVQQKCVNLFMCLFIYIIFIYLHVYLYIYLFIYLKSLLTSPKIQHHMLSLS